MKKNRPDNTLKESEIQGLIVEYLQAKGTFVWRQHSVGIRGRTLVGRGVRKGVSDLLGLMNSGRGFALEVKVPGKNPSSNQASFLREFALAGGLSACVHSLEEVIALGF